MKLPSATSRSQVVQNLFHRNVELADRDDDLDMDVLTAAAWENITKAGNGTINWNAVFGVPADALGVFVRTVQVDDANGAVVSFKAKNTTTNASFSADVPVANTINYDHGLVPIAANGTSFYDFGAWTFTTFYLRVVGWIRP